MADTVPERLGGLAGEASVAIGLGEGDRGHQGDDLT